MLPYGAWVTSPCLASFLILGMLWMPFVRRASASWVRVLLGLTVGLLAFLAIDATLEAVELVAENGSFGGPMVVFLGAVTAYLILEGTDAWMRRHQNLNATGQPAALPPRRLALLIAIASDCTTSAKDSPSGRPTRWGPSPWAPP
jgi:hypothetical protein